MHVCVCVPVQACDSIHVFCVNAPACAHVCVHACTGMYVCWDSSFIMLCVGIPVS